MQVRVPIGEFSRMTYLSVKALRHYHESGIFADLARVTLPDFRLGGAETPRPSATGLISTEGSGTR
jgi:hypothetical protein